MFFKDKHDVIKNVGKKSKDQKIIDRVNNYHYSTSKPIWPIVTIVVFLIFMSIFVK